MINHDRRPNCGGEMIAKDVMVVYAQEAIAAGPMLL
jgi:hypothetical protein